MPGSSQARIGDKAKAEMCVHGCPNCPHKVQGPTVAGSDNVFINKLGAVRSGDRGVHTACCAMNEWFAGKGSATVYINRKPAFRVGDPSIHCGGMGVQFEGSDDVVIGG